MSWFKILVTLFWCFLIQGVASTVNVSDAGQDSDGADIAFIISTSGQTQLYYEKLFAKEVMVKLAQNSTKIRAAVVTFSGTYSASVKLNFTKKFNLQQFISTINRIPYKYTRWISIGKALEITSERVFRSSRQHVPKIAILIVDYYDFYWSDNARVRIASERVKQEGVRLVVVVLPPCFFLVNILKTRKNMSQKRL
ncbi:hypothetical protein OS493_017471 [Desmophyllum pertusum]|uniref:VWFA domain-containing protein n=1 Tax=Desmophyllum pertusum TaxID=174260 RepID=A0A9W9ZQQ8_9CNID|nr:hypothetical protein OS493_017471 [Desmophyllum pertusum]